MAKKPPSRPGGRSERVRGAVFAAVEALMAQNKGDLPSMGEIAAHAGVNPTSLYRRWGDVKYLAAEVAFERVNRDFPIPDTGTLRGDMLGWASAAARHMSERKTSMLLRVVAAGTQSFPERALPIEQRSKDLEVMLERARARGEAAPDLLEVLEIVMAPIYLRLLFMGPIRDPSFYAARLVDRALALAQTRAKPKRGRRSLKAPA
jgi:AcrR family transcriptional regulator